MNSKKVITLIASIAIPLVLGFSSSLFAGNIEQRYTSLAKPPLSPPSSLFGIAWTILYILMGIACYLILTADFSRAKKTPAIIVYAAQLVVNFAWSIIFFRVDQFWIAFVVIVLLDILVAATIMLFWGIRKPAAILLLPYMAWLLFATYLNIGFAILN